MALSQTRRDVFCRTTQWIIHQWCPSESDEGKEEFNGGGGGLVERLALQVWGPEFGSHTKKPGTVVICTSNCREVRWEAETGGPPELCRSDSLGYTSSSRPMTDAVLNKMWEGHQRTDTWGYPLTSTWVPCAPVYPWKEKNPKKQSSLWTDTASLLPSHSQIKPFDPEHLQQTCPC